MEYSLNIVLIEPEIPQNTGNIARTCAATGARLHLVGPMGFQITEKQVRRAGLDYWDKLDITYYDSQEDFLKKTRAAVFSISPQRLNKRIQMYIIRMVRTLFSARKPKVCPRNCSRKITITVFVFR